MSQAKPPKQTQQEKDLLAKQTDLLDQQQKTIESQINTQNLLAPILYKQLGLTPQMDEQGNITGFTESADSQAATAQNKEISDLLGKRSLAALKGELPQDPGLLNELAKQEDTLKASLAKNLGSDYATSTPGIQALAEFNKNKSATLSAASRGDITLAESLGLARQGTNSAQTYNTIGATSGIGNQNSVIAQLFGSTAAGYSQITNQLAQQRIQNYLLQPEPMGSRIGQGVGSLIGTAVGAYFGGPMGASAGGSAGGGIGGLLGSFSKH